MVIINYPIYRFSYHVRERLGLQPGDRIDFVVEDNAVRLVRRQDRIEAIFGLYKAEVSVSDEEMARAIRQSHRGVG